MQRRSIHVQGTVQGVGFRPFVYRLATRFGLTGFVRNDAGFVSIEVEGSESSLDQFNEALVDELPPLARIMSLDKSSISCVGDVAFAIESSGHFNNDAVIISADVATCDACLAELFDSGDRRFRYPFINCTNCGPRLSIVTGFPYDRERTTMRAFAMCAACRKEYENPADRRFHAQPIACRECGPRLSAMDSDGHRILSEDPLDWFVAQLSNGRVGVMKGLGGYHLVVDAKSDPAVAELRRRKHRDERPFAIMVEHVEAAEAVCHLSAPERVLLTSRRRPIVLLNRRSTAELSPSIAPENLQLGVMLPYTPLHHLLLRAFGGALVMTSGNRSDEPIAYEDDDALQRLSGIADCFLMHDRPIHVRCDDSVTRIVDGSELPIRRARGYAPQPISLPFECKTKLLAVGAQMKSTFALVRDRMAIVSQHMGDLEHFEASRAFERDIALYESLFAIQPELIAHDLHPDYAGTRYALKRDVKGIGVQHHHAHMASCMVDNGLPQDAEVIGVIWDGTGFGTDQTIWGGEFLVGGYRDYRRAAHLRPVRLPGGDRAAREPWRMALSNLRDANLADTTFLTNRLDSNAVRIVETMIARGLNAPFTSSAGRLFDAVASLIGLRDLSNFEGQAAIQLEQLAASDSDTAPYPFAIDDTAVLNTPVLDTRPMIRAIVEDVLATVLPSRIARRFHSTLAEMIAATCERIRQTDSINSVVLSGGVFMNALLTTDATQALQSLGFVVLRHHQVPPNDAGISLGQLAVAAAQLRIS